ncbi:Uncharacterised protein [Chlamydia trachomatis]|nr:Uncharacterised protein [Chlamydia trachomatis]
MITYYILTKFWYFKKHPQKEIESNYSDEFLGTTVGRDWYISIDELPLKDAEITGIKEAQ